MAETVPVEVIIHHNNARLYEALERSTRRLSAVLMELPLEMRKHVNADIRDNLEALAAGPRNCDKYGFEDHEGMALAHFAWCRKFDQCQGCPIEPLDYSKTDCMSAWLLLPVQEGGAS